jgi:hypothetical protein
VPTLSEGWVVSLSKGARTGSTLRAKFLGRESPRAPQQRRVPWATNNKPKSLAAAETVLPKSSKKELEIANRGLSRDDSLLWPSVGLAGADGGGGEFSLLADVGGDVARAAGDLLDGGQVL